VSAGILDHFITRHGGSWNHADWLGLLHHLEQTGHWPIDEQKVGETLEAVRTKWANQRRWAEEMTNPIGMRLKRIEPGTFLMGSEKGKKVPVHRVTISSPFFLGVHEVTQEQYEMVMGSNPSRYKGPRLPLESVSWIEAKRFCKGLSEMEGATYRLPTEAEWEYACRAATKGDYSFGDDDTFIREFAWYDGNSGQQTHEVGSKMPNPWGIFDMHGNVCEWCEDWDGPYQPTEKDPTGYNHGTRKLVRGGCWGYESERLRSWVRFEWLPDERDEKVGFRVVRLA